MRIKRILHTTVGEVVFECYESMNLGTGKIDFHDKKGKLEGLLLYLTGSFVVDPIK